MARPWAAMSEQGRCQLDGGEGLHLQGPDQGERGEHSDHFRGRHDHRDLRVVADDQGCGDREHEDADGQPERPPHDGVVAEQVQPGREAGEGPLHDQEQQREDDADQPQDAEAHSDQRLGHAAAGHGRPGGDPRQQQAESQPGRREQQLHQAGPQPALRPAEPPRPAGGEPLHHGARTVPRGNPAWHGLLRVMRARLTRDRRRRTGPGTAAVPRWPRGVGGLAAVRDDELVLNMLRTLRGSPDFALKRLKTPAPTCLVPRG